MIRILILTGLALPLVAGSLRADDRYFLLMFGSQQSFKNPENDHTFATFVKRSEGPEGVRLESRTISWLPSSGKVRLRALLPEPGRNYGLEETIRFVQKDRQRVSLWGPYEIQPELFEKANEQIARLESGQIRYKAFDGFYRSDNVSNCIHAVAVVTGGHRIRVLSPGWGDSASYFVLESMMPWVVDRMTTHDHLACELGLNEYAIAYRKVFPKPNLPPATGLRLVLKDGRPEPTYGPPARRGR